ncbi:hypothetical protein [Ornithinimicrobium cerasi]|uniref:hypothetical protein n=1 Tax=Ornithinimicrobium cerasi TaxID=2248773 RepID=UPI0013796D38|nr:hypothetical protein [Ornithinimicrobium cerasi]
MSSPRPSARRPAGAHRPRRRRVVRWTVVVVALLVVLVVGGPQYALWSGEPVAAKD